MWFYGTVFLIKPGNLTCLRFAIVLGVRPNVELFVRRTKLPIDLFSFYVLFSHFIPRDGTPRELFLSNVHPRARVCIIDEKPNGKFPGEHHVV